jgi:PLP dependent protein
LKSPCSNKFEHATRIYRIVEQQIADNVNHVRERIADAAIRSGRTAEDVTCVAVTKYLPVGSPIYDALFATGCEDLGESRPQHLMEKIDQWSGPPVRWHMIGSLQRNKVRKILPHVALIHSVDSLRLLEAIDRIADEESLPPVPILLEVNISGDASKKGLDPNELVPLLDQSAERYTNVEIRGLMAMAGLMSRGDEARREFASVRELRDNVQTRFEGRFDLAWLSMGMSRDYETAIEEGATHVRVGSSLYEGIEY